MSFVDYGFDIFSIGSSNRQNALQACGDWLPLKHQHQQQQHQLLGKDTIADDTSSSNPENSCYHVIIDHLIDLGTCAENELVLIRAELEKYKRLKLTDEQIDQLKDLEAEYTKEYVEKCIKNSASDGNRGFITEDFTESDDTSSVAFGKFSSNAWNIPGITFPEKDTCKTGAYTCYKNTSSVQPFFGTPFFPCTQLDGETSPRRAIHRDDSETSLCDMTFRSTIIQKDSEIISLKTESAAKGTELKEVKEKNKALKMTIEKLKGDIRQLENSLRASQAQLVNLTRQMNEELDMTKDNYERLQQELKDDRQARAFDVREVTKLQTEAQTLHKNLSDELKIAKRRVETLESTTASQAANLKQLQQERDSLDKLNCEQENEIEKLLNIIKRLNEKYDKSKADLSRAKEELDIRERKVAQCREQLEAMEREVSKLITELAECLGHRGVQRKQMGGHGDSDRSRQGMYAQARELTRGLNRIVREHERCHSDREDLLREIDRLGAINQAQVESVEIESVKKDAVIEINRLREVVQAADHFQTVKVDMQCIIDELLTRIDSRMMEKAEQAYKEVASEASLALERLDKKINDHDVYRRCESFLLLELENLQTALDGAEKTINGLVPSEHLNGLEMSSMNNEIEEKRRKLYQENDNCLTIKSVLSKKILQQVQDSTQIVIRITTALRDDSTLKLTYNQKLESQMQQTLKALNQISVEKCELQNAYDECQQRTNELAIEVERLKVALGQKANDVQALNDKLQARCEMCRSEIEALRKQVSQADKRYQESREENGALIKKSDEIINTLQRELQNKNVKLLEFGRFNDYLNSKLEESNRMIKQLQNSIVQESMRKVDLDSFTALHDRILELVREKDELTEKIAILESQLASLERNNSKMQDHLTKLYEENEYLDKCIKTFKSENERLGTSIANQDDKTKLGAKCDELLEKIEQIAKHSIQIPRRGTTSATDLTIRTLEKEMKTQKDKLRYQQKELLMKEKEILDMNKKIEVLNNYLNKAKGDTAGDNPAHFLERIDVLTREKNELKNELKQTLAKYEDKLAEMHKQYKHNEIELHKNHNESIRHLEAKYIEMMKEEGKPFTTQNWIQSLNAHEMQELHDTICKSPLCASSSYTKELYEEHKKKTLQKNTASNYSMKKPSISKKDIRGVKNTVATKSSSRQRISARDSLNSIVIPEKEYSVQNKNK